MHRRDLPTVGRRPDDVVPSVSVVIPVRSDGPELRLCLESLARQSVRPLEIIVVDNGSDDDSVDIARAAGAHVLSEPRRGIPAASSTGYDAATGDVIARLDADCVAPADWVETVRDRFARDPGLAAITGGARFHDGPRWLRRIGALLYLGSYFFLVTGALGHVPLFGSNCAFRRSVWQSVRTTVHRRDADMHDDMDLSVHIGPIRRIRYVRSLRMGISSRPLFAGRNQIRLRFTRAAHTLTTHWPAQLPPIRLLRRLCAFGHPASSS